MTSPLPNSLPSQTITPMNIGDGAALIKPIGKAIKKGIKRAGKNAVAKQQAANKEKAAAKKAAETKRSDALAQFKHIQTIGDNYSTPSSSLKDKPANFERNVAMSSSTMGNARRGARSSKTVVAPQGAPGESKPSRLPSRAQSSFGGNHSAQFKDL